MQPGSIASGGSVTVVVKVKPSAKGTITNKVSVTGTLTDPNTANNTTTANTSVIP